MLIWLAYLTMVCECNLDQINEFKKGCNFTVFFFEINTHARDFKINPSLRTLRLLSFKVLPVEVISVIISDDPTKGYVSVAPRLGTILYWVTPFETRKLLVKFGYLVATRSLIFFLSLKLKETSSKSATVWTSI